MKVRSVVVRRVWDCMRCGYVSEEGGDGKGADSETPSLQKMICFYFIMNQELLL
jgi:hypothetical protein